MLLWREGVVFGRSAPSSIFYADWNCLSSWNSASLLQTLQSPGRLREIPANLDFVKRVQRRFLSYETEEEIVSTLKSKFRPSPQAGF